MKRDYVNIAVFTGIAVFTLGVSPLRAQKVKSQKELQAIQEVQKATTPDDRIKAIENVLENFADTEFKVPLLQMAVQTEEQKGDYAQIVFYGERLLKADPKNAFAQVTLASETARHTRQNDLDKDEQLAKVDKWAKDGIEDAKVAPKPRADYPDADWENARKDMQAQGYVALAMAAVLQKNFDTAAANYKQSLSIESTPNPATLIRLAQVYMDQGKLDDANYTLDKAINTPNVPAQIKSIAENFKSQIARARAAHPASAAAPPAGSAAPASPAAPAGNH